MDTEITFIHWNVSDRAD